MNVLSAVKLSEHPNTRAAGGAGAGSIVLIYVFSLFGIELPGLVAAAAVTLITMGVLFVGRRWQPKRKRKTRRRRSP